MKKLLLPLFLWATTTQAQTLIAYDYIENWSWGSGGAGWAVGSGATGYYINAFVSSNASAALIGSGNGSSPIESGTYILSNMTGLDPSATYTLKFRAGAYRFAGPTAATAGNDAGDYFDVQYSSDGGVTYTTEMRVRGFSNAYWDYNTNATALKVIDGTMTTYQPTAGGDRTSTGDGYSVIELTIPTGVSQLEFRIPARVNSRGEEWWFDDFELWETAPSALPVEMISFTGESTSNGNVISWKTASESNSSYFTIERSTTGEFNENSVIGYKSAAGNSNEEISYAFVDRYFESQINYYQITQVDKDGNYKTYGPIVIDNTKTNKTVIKYVNLLGQEIDPQNAIGLVIEIYSDGSSQRVIK